jgi:hypothetical protein
MSRKYLLIIFLPLLILACKTLFPEPAARQQPTVAPTHLAIKTSAPQQTIVAAPTSEADTPAPAKGGYTLVRLEPSDGDLPELLAAEVEKAAALGQIPVVEFDAPW